LYEEGQDLYSFELATLNDVEIMPIHPAKTEVLFGTAVSMTTTPASRSAVQVVSQAIPAGRLVAVPAPLPDLLTDSRKVM